ncbi:MAG: hypothetical protein ACFE7R_04050 [Candidatus Hodarchaeota archaeon]
MPDATKVYIDCYDANGFYEENYNRIMLIMSRLASSNLLKREWVSSQAVGGTWARSIRCKFETNLDAHEIKSFMVGLEYSDLSEVPEAIRPTNNAAAFRFADIDVIELREKEGSAVHRMAGRLKLSEKKIGIGDIREGESDVEFVISCREKLLNRLDDDTREELLGIEKSIFEELQRAT